MAHHAYFVSGSQEDAVVAAQAYAEQELQSPGHPAEVLTLTFGLFSVDDARRLISAASTSGTGGQKVIIASMTRIFHEAQNALLKIVEEPPQGTTIILCVPAEGVFIPTLRSRLLPLPAHMTAERLRDDSIASRFIAASAAEREKIAGKLVEQSKSDKEETKQQARQDAIELLQGLMAAGHALLMAQQKELERTQTRLFLEDFSVFMPILYERSAPLKLILEHLLLVIPTDLREGRV